jgi:GAF domain-containing protein
MVQDLDSANHTTLNGHPVTKMPLHEGDVIGIADFSIEVHFEPEGRGKIQDKPLDLADTVVDSEVNIPSIYQTSRHADRVIHLSAVHLQNFYKLNIAICGQTDQEALLSSVTDILLSQLNAYHIWAGLRETTAGPLTCHCGRSRSGGMITLEGMSGKEIIKQALQKETYILLPDFVDFLSPTDSHAPEMGNIKSAMAAPIVAPAGAYGVIYVNNGIDQSAYTYQDLDYLTLVSVQLAAMIEHIA